MNLDQVLDIAENVIFAFGLLIVWALLPTYAAFSRKHVMRIIGLDKGQLPWVISSVFGGVFAILGALWGLGAVLVLEHRGSIERFDEWGLTIIVLFVATPIFVWSLPPPANDEKTAPAVQQT